VVKVLMQLTGSVESETDLTPSGLLHADLHYLTNGQKINSHLKL
jgi:hypothetical protein